MRRFLGLVVVGILGGCQPGFEAVHWNPEVANEATLTAPAMSNGMAVSLGPAAFDLASQVVTEKLGEAWPDGVVVVATNAPPESPSLDPSTWVPDWAGARMETGYLSLSASPLGIEIILVVALASSEVVVDLGDGGACTVEMSFEGGVVRGRVVLGRTKHGHIQASLAGNADLDVESLQLGTGGCPATVVEALAGGGQDPEWLEGLATQTLATLAPWMGGAIPEALGLHLTATMGASFGDDGIGVGTMDVSIRAPDPTLGTWWHFANGQLVVAYDITIDGEGHPCVPPENLPLAAGSPPPVVAGDRATLMHIDVIRRGLGTLWRAGGMCLERLTWPLAATAEHYASSWSALAGLAPEAAVGLRLWPEASLSLAVEQGAEGLEATLDAGPWTVEIMGTVHGTRWRLATVRLSGQVRAGVTVGPDRAVRLDATEVQVQILSVAAGLLGAPELEEASALGEAVMTAVVGSLPVAWLPPSPGAAQTHTSLQGDYLVFASEP